MQREMKTATFMDAKVRRDGRGVNDGVFWFGVWGARRVVAVSLAGGCGLTTAPTGGIWGEWWNGCGFGGKEPEAPFTAGG